MSNIYKYKRSTLTPFVKYNGVLNLAVFYVQSALHAIRKLFYYLVLQDHVIISTKCPKNDKKNPYPQSA